MNENRAYGKQGPDGLTHGRGYVYYLKYHIVWCTKYRRPVLEGVVRDSCIDLIMSAASDQGASVDAIDVMSDHVHVLVSASPQVNIPNLIKVMKGNSARSVLLHNPSVKKSLWGGHLWNPSYCVVTASDRTEEMIRSYIENQEVR